MNFRTSLFTSHAKVRPWPSQPKQKQRSALPGISSSRLARAQARRAWAGHVPAGTRGAASFALLRGGCRRGRPQSSAASETHCAAHRTSTCPALWASRLSSTRIFIALTFAAFQAHRGEKGLSSTLAALVFRMTEIGAPPTYCWRGPVQRSDAWNMT